MCSNTKGHRVATLGAVIVIKKKEGDEIGVTWKGG
jgi:hypothetical protein